MEDIIIIRNKKVLLKTTRLIASIMLIAVIISSCGQKNVPSKSPEYSEIPSALPTETETETATSEPSEPEEPNLIDMSDKLGFKFKIYYEGKDEFENYTNLHFEYDSIKTEVFERLFELNKPFAMLVGVVGLFESQARFNMFKDNKFELMYFNKRVSYLRSYQDEKPALNPPFSSVYVCHNFCLSRLYLKL